MPENRLQPTAIDALTVINTAMRGLRLYPAGSPIITNALHKANQILGVLLSGAEQLVFAEAEKVLIVNDEPLNEKILQKPPVRAFLETMLDSGLRTISLYRGITPYELQVFLELLSQGGENIASAGGMAALVRRRHLPHIRIDEKRFVALDKGQRIAPAQVPETAEPDSTASGQGPAQGPEVASRVLYSGLQPFADLAQGGRSAETQVIFDQLIEDLSGLNGSAVAAGPPEAPAALGLDAENLASLLDQSFTAAPDNTSPAVESLFAHFKAVIQTHLRSRRYAAADRILEAFENAAGRSACPSGLRNLVQTLLDAVAEESLLHGLVQGHREGDPADPPIIGRILRRLMPASTDFLLQRLRGSQSLGERSHLMRLLPEFGDALHPALLHHIANGGPWYYMRNLAGLLGKIARPEDLPVLENLLGHPDPRVQREALVGLYAIEDERRGAILLRFLPQAHDPLKLTVVTLLGALAYKPAAAALTALLESWWPRCAKSGEGLAEKTCAALGRIGDSAAVATLEKLIAPRGIFARGPGARVEGAARKALAQIRATPKPAAETNAGTPQADDPATGEADVDGLAAAGDSQAAIERLLGMIQTAAATGRFAEAERLREKLYDIDALALGPIIQAGEIIEAEKSRAVDPDHVKIFAPLYGQLTEAQRSALYHAMTPQHFASGETLVHQGRINDRLYFINRGSVKIVHRRGSGEMLLDRPGAGSFAGGESFFKATVATAAVLALEPVAATCLTRSGLAGLLSEHPGLKSRLQDYVVRRDTTAEQLRRRAIDRRRHPRHPIQGRIKVQILDRQGCAVGRPFLGTLSECSIGGTSFSIGSSRPETARILLGRHLQLDFAIARPASPRKVSARGTVIAVDDLMASEYCLHVRFDQHLDSAVAEDLARTAVQPPL